MSCKNMKKVSLDPILKPLTDRLDILEQQVEQLKEQLIAIDPRGCPEDNKEDLDEVELDECPFCGGM